MSLFVLIVMDAGLGAAALAAIVRHDRAVGRACAEKRRWLLRRFAAGDLDLAAYQDAVAGLDDDRRGVWTELRTRVWHVR